MTNEREQRATRAEQMRRDRERAEKRQRNFITLGIVAVVVALIAAAAFAVTSQNKKRAHNTQLIPPAGATKDFGVVYTPKDAGGKASKDTVRVVIYEDMQCPICQRFESANGQYLGDAVKSGDIEIEYRFVAFLDDLGSSPNEYSRRASNAVLCARDTGPKQWKTLHDLFYANQPEEKTLGPNDNELVQSAVSVGVPKSAAEACILKHKYVPWLEASTKAMAKAKVTGTPTVRVDGKNVQGANGGIPTMLDIQKAVDAARK
ncbi:MAG: DsbA family protein [Aeromicrobium sp.]